MTQSFIQAIQWTSHVSNIFYATISSKLRDMKTYVIFVEIY